MLRYYVKLNKRNPIYTTKIESIPIVYDINNRTNNATLPLLNDKKDATYKDYLNIAFSRSEVKNRNDYLIAGIYKMFYWAYTIDRSHTVTTMQYDAKNIQEANKMMQVIQYRVENEKDAKGNYLFLTWQRQWQVDVLKSIYTDKNIDVNKYKKEELIKASNMNFRITSEGMIFTLQESLRYLGEESTNLGTSAIKSVFLFL
ncbi:hypothetical protein N9X61_03785 [Sulfurimonas sp.]|nr:hypothetical protein [Sulfurimonas sp.]